MNAGDGKRLFVYECLAPGLPSNEPGEQSLVGIWPEPPYYYLFFESPVDQVVAEWIRAQGGWELKGRYEIDYDQWQQVPTAAQSVGSFVILSHDLTPPPICKPGTRTLLMDPGLVFGSGLHPTTRGCLLAIEQLFARYPIRDAVDFGTGTGILSIACALQGATRVVAIDCNLMAARVARRNFELNGVNGAVRAVVADDPGILRLSADLILMNIEWPCLKRIVPGNSWRHHALAVLSGFMESQWLELSSLIPESHSMIHQESQDGWLTVVMKSREIELHRENS